MPSETFIPGDQIEDNSIQRIDLDVTDINTLYPSLTASRAQNSVFAGPIWAAGPATFRALVVSDIPSFSANATSASWASSSISASYATTASYVPNLYSQVSQITVPSASWVSASVHIINSDTASFVSNLYPQVAQVSCSWASASLSSSYALIASRILIDNGIGNPNTEFVFPIISATNTLGVWGGTDSLLSFNPNIPRLKVGGTIEAIAITASLLGTASYALTSSYALNGGTGGTSQTTVPSASWVSASAFITLAQTASYIDAGNITTGTLNNARLPSQINVTGISGSFTGSFKGSLTGTASWAITASYALNTTLTTGATYPITSSWSNNSISSSYVSGSQSTIGTLDVRNNIKNSVGDTVIYNDVSGKNVIIQCSSNDNQTITIDSNSQNIIFDSPSGNAQFNLPIIADTVTATTFVGTASYANKALSASYAQNSALANTVTVINTAVDDQYYIALAGGSLYSDTSGDFYYNPGQKLLSAINIESTSITGSLSGTASYALNGGSGGSLTNGATYPITSSWATTASYALTGGSGDSSVSASYFSGSNVFASTVYSNVYILTGSYNPQFTASWTLTNNENGKFLIVSSSNNINMSVPAGLNQGFACSFYQSGSGQISVISGSNSVNIRSRIGLSSSYAQYSIISLMQTDTTGYCIQGDVG